MPHSLISDWKAKIVYTPQGPEPQVLAEDHKMKVVVAGLQAGQAIPEHPEARGVYHFLEGEGVMIVDGERLNISPGATVIVEQGATRGMQAKSQLAFIAVRVK